MSFRIAILAALFGLFTPTAMVQAGDPIIRLAERRNMNSSFALGRIIRTSEVGWFFKSWAVEFLYGAANDPDVYLALPYSLSLARWGLVDQINHLDVTRPWIIEYSKPLWPINLLGGPRITAIHPTYLSRELAEIDLDEKFVEKTPPVGNYELSRYVGRIIKVQRYGSHGNLCTLTLHAAGGQEQSFNTPERANYFKTVMNVKKMSLRSEAGCRYVENILPFGKITEIDATESYEEVLNDSSRVARIQILH